MRTKIVPLIKEPHPETYNGLPFLTLIEYKNTYFITIVDNFCDKQITAYVLDICESEGVNRDLILVYALEWWENEKDLLPFSFFLSKHNAMDSFSPIYKTYQTEHITRAIGPIPSFKMDGIVSVKRRCRRDVSAIPIIAKT